MALILGLLIGIAFGFVLKKSRICYMGTIRDIYLEGRNYNLLLLFATIFTESILYNIFVLTGLVADGYVSCFSLVALPVGSMIFRFGAIMIVVLELACATGTQGDDIVRTDLAEGLDILPGHSNGGLALPHHFQRRAAAGLGQGEIQYRQAKEKCWLSHVRQVFRLLPK